MIIPSGYAQVNFMWTGANVPTGAECAFGVGAGGATAEEIAQDVADTIGAVDLFDRISNQVTLTTVKAKLGPNSTGPVAELSVAVPGDAGGSCSPPQVAWLVRKSTALGGRRGRGRLFFPGVPEGSVDQAGVLDTTVSNAFQGLLDDWLSALAVSGHSMVVLHADNTAPTVVTSLALQAKVATQRRRLRR